MSDEIKAAHIIAEALNWVGWALIWTAGIIFAGLTIVGDIRVEVKKDE